MFCRSGRGVHRRNTLIVAGSVVLFTAFIRTLILIGSLIRYPLTFIRSLRRCLEVPMCLFSIIFVVVFWRDCYCPTSWQWQFGTAAVLLAWVDLILVVRRIQAFDIGMCMEEYLW